MGGCASKPKESDIPQESLPTEDSAAPKKADGETFAQRTNNADHESQSEAPLVDLSKEKDGNSSSEPKTVEAAPVSVEAGEETAKTIEETVEGPANESKEKVEAGNETQEPAKEGQAEAKTDKTDATPGSEHKSDAPLATA